MRKKQSFTKRFTRHEDETEISRVAQKKNSEEKHGRKRRLMVSEDNLIVVYS